MYKVALKILQKKDIMCLGKLQNSKLKKYHKKSMKIVINSPIIAATTWSANNYEHHDCTSLFVFMYLNIYEPCNEKTNNVVSAQIQHKPNCTSKEDGQSLEILD